METLIDQAETMRRLCIGRTKFFELLGDHELESVKIGRRRLVVSSSVDSYIERLRLVPQQAASGEAVRVA